MTRAQTILGALGAAVVLALVPVPAGAAGPLRVITGQVTNPVNLSVRDSRVSVADAGTSTVYRLRGDGSPAVLAREREPRDVAGVDVAAGGRVAYTSTDVSSTFEPSQGALIVLGPGRSRRRVDLYGYEGANNPDGAVHYGGQNPGQCAYRALKGAGFNPDYTGQTLSHPYAVAGYGTRSWIVADINANDLLEVDGLGRVSTVAVLPPVSLTITAEIAESVQIYPCAAGVVYDFQARPSDVEVGPDGMLYVTTMPGRHFNALLPPLGQLYRVDPISGRLTLLASGLAGASNLAVDPRGRIYVAEQSLGRVSIITDGRAVPLRELPGVVSLEYAGGRLYAGVVGSSSNPGGVVTFTP